MSSLPKSLKGEWSHTKEITRLFDHANSCGYKMGRSIERKKQFLSRMDNFIEMGIPEKEIADELTWIGQNVKKATAKETWEAHFTALRSLVKIKVKRRQASTDNLPDLEEILFSREREEPEDARTNYLSLLDVDDSDEWEFCE